jgi:luciferase family oxidoreductase group 1
MKENKVRLSIFDQSPVKIGGTAHQAILDTIRLAKLVERLGYTRYWVAELHNLLGYASSAPEIMVAQLAAQTKKIRIGSGGVMLPNHSALKVSENFRLLELLFPGRIDLGLGRASGTDPKTAEILNPAGKRTNEEFALKLEELLNYLHDKPQSGDEKVSTYAIPQIDTTPPIWLLSSGGQTAESAAQLGTGLAVTHFMTIDNMEVVQRYRDNFKPSAEMSKPELIVGAFVFCSEDREVLSRYQTVMDYHFLHMSKFGVPSTKTYDEIKDLTYTAEDHEKINFVRRRMISGTPDDIKPKIDQLLHSYQANELMMPAFSENFEDRARSFELLADLFLKG